MACDLNFAPSTDQAPAYVVWDEDTTPLRHVLRLDAASYKTDLAFDIPPAPWPEGGEYVVSPRGSFAYQNRIVPEGQPLRLFGRQQGVVVWNGDVVIPTLVDLSRRCHTGERFDPGTPVEDRVQTGA